jgi:hypothetical protein
VATLLFALGSGAGHEKTLEKLLRFRWGAIMGHGRRQGAVGALGETVGTSRCDEDRQILSDYFTRVQMALASRRRDASGPPSMFS